MVCQRASTYKQGLERKGSCKPPGLGLAPPGSDPASSFCLYRPGPRKHVEPWILPHKGGRPAGELSWSRFLSTFHGRVSLERGWQPATPGLQSLGPSATYTFPLFKRPLSPNRSLPHCPIIGRDNESVSRHGLIHHPITIPWASYVPATLWRKGWSWYVPLLWGAEAYILEGETQQWDKCTQAPVVKVQMEQSEGIWWGGPGGGSHFGKGVPRKWNCSWDLRREGRCGGEVAFSQLQGTRVWWCQGKGLSVNTYWLNELNNVCKFNILMWIRTFWGLAAPSVLSGFPEVLESPHCQAVPCWA